MSKQNLSRGDGTRKKSKDRYCLRRKTIRMQNRRGEPLERNYITKSVQKPRKTPCSAKAIYSKIGVTSLNCHPEPGAPFLAFFCKKWVVGIVIRIVILSEASGFAKRSACAVEGSLYPHRHSRMSQGILPAIARDREEHEFT
jgi:hypothetical protein